MEILLCDAHPTIWLTMQWDYRQLYQVCDIYYDIILLPPGDRGRSVTDCVANDSSWHFPHRSRLTIEMYRLSTPMSLWCPIYLYFCSLFLPIFRVSPGKRGKVSNPKNTAVTRWYCDWHPCIRQASSYWRWHCCLSSPPTLTQIMEKMAVSVWFSTLLALPLLGII